MSAVLGPKPPKIVNNVPYSQGRDHRRFCEKKAEIDLVTSRKILELKKVPKGLVEKLLRASAIFARHILFPTVGGQELKICRPKIAEPLRSQFWDFFDEKNFGCQKGPKFFLQKFLHPFCRNFCTKNGLFRPQLSEASRGLKWSYDLSILGSSKRRLDVSDLKLSSKNIENSRFYARMSAAPVGTFWTTFWTISLRILGCFEKWYFFSFTQRL